MKRSLDNAVEQMGEMLRAFPWDNAIAYSDWCAQTYYYVMHSTRLLAAAAARLPHDARGNALHHRFAVHMAEEKSHELLALHDMKTMNRGGLETFTELASTRMFYEPQYFKIEHIDPMALFGYVLPLEVMSAKRGHIALDAAKAAWGSKCVTFLKVHVDEDVDHVEKAYEAVAHVTPAQQTMLIASFEQTTVAYKTMLDQIRERAHLFTATANRTAPTSRLADASA